MRLSRTAVLAGTVLAALAAGVGLRVGLGGPGFGPPLAQAQNLGQRVVFGSVLNGADEHVVGATVFLKDLKTKTIRSYSTPADGHFRFTQVNMAEDHELWAEKGDKKSAIKSVSSWDTRKEFETDLKLK